MDAHTQSVAEIATSIKRFSSLRRPFRNYHGSTNSTRASARHRDSSIDTSALNRVLRVDRAGKTATVEPNVPMDALVRATLREGLVPLVVMEFPGITAGGGFCGTSGESSSFREGFFDNTVDWIEVVTAGGEVVRAGREEGAELFWGVASGFGGLGVVTLLEVRLREAGAWVELGLRPFGSVGAAMEGMGEAMGEGGVDYVDGIVYARDSIVLCVGRMVGELPPGAEVRRFSRARDPWFYLFAQRRTGSVSRLPFASASPRPATVHVPIEDYLFRYDRGAFWVGRYAFQYFLTPFNRITRWAIDSFMHTRTMYRALHASGQAKIYLIQDVAIPFPKAEEFHNWLDGEFGIFPIWLCPLRQRRDGGKEKAGFGLYAALADERQPEFMLNFGVWGPGKRDWKRFVGQNRELEKKVGELGGRKWLYAQAFYTEDEFWSIYDKEDYERLREKYGAGYLPSVYDKVKVDLEGEEGRGRKSWGAWVSDLVWDVWPLSGLYGVYKACEGGEYLMQKRAEAPAMAVKRE